MLYRSGRDGLFDGRACLSLYDPGSKHVGWHWALATGLDISKLDEGFRDFINALGRNSPSVPVRSESAVATKGNECLKNLMAARNWTKGQEDERA